MPRIIEVLHAGEKQVLVTDEPIDVELDGIVAIAGVPFHAIPASSGLRDSFALSDAESRLYPDDFFLGSNVVRA